MPRVASLWFPTLSTDRLRPGATDRLRGNRSAPSPDGPLVTVAVAHGRRVLVACSRAALAAGLRPGQPLAEARVLAADLVTAEADPAADAALLARIAAHAARRWTPLAAADPPDGLLLDIGAAAHLFGGEAGLARRILATARRGGLAARLAVAGSAGAAHALARYGPDRLTIVAPGDDAEALGALPPAALRLEEETVAAIARLGFATIADLLAAPRAPLIRRFGARFGVRIEQALGRRAEPIDALIPPTLPAARRALAEPIGTPDAIAQVIQDLAGDLCKRLETRGLGASTILLLCRRIDGRDETVAIGLARPSRDAAHLADLLRRKIETIDPGLGIEAMLLLARRTGPLTAAQLAVPKAPLSGPVDDPDLPTLVDRLANRFGPSALHRGGLVESDTPERMVGRLAALAPATARDWRIDWPRPCRLLRRPEPIDHAIADLPDYAPAAFTWRGTRYRVTAADGPERICGEWWRGGGDPRRVRDYFQVEVTGGGRYWLFRAGDGVHPAAGPGDWFLHGAFG